MDRREFLLGGAAAVAAGCTSVGGKVCGAKGGNPLFHLGMAGYTYRDFSTNAMLEAMERLDVRYLCVKSFHLPFTATDSEIATFRQKCEDHGVVPYGLGPVTSDKFDDFKVAFDFAKRLGVDTVVAIPYKDGPKKSDLDRTGNREICERASDLCDSYGVKFAIHNHGPDFPLLFPTGESICEAVRDLSPRMGMCLDIGHEYRSFKDPAGTIRRYHDRLFDLHLKNLTTDAATRKGDVAVPLPRGVLDLPSVFRALIEVGYAGCCSIEYEADFKDNYAKLAECVGYYKGAMDML